MIGSIGMILLLIALLERNSLRLKEKDRGIIMRSRHWISGGRSD